VDGFIRGRGFFDLRVNFDDQLLGEARIKQLNAKNVLIDPDASSYDPDEWAEVFVTKWLTLSEVERAYGKRASNELDAVGGMHSHRYDTADWLPDTFGGENTWGGYDSFREADRRRIYRVIERQYKELKWADHFVDVNTGDMREIPDNWERARIAFVMDEYGLGLYRKKIHKIRWTVSTDQLLFHDDISPYRHFTPIPFFPFFLHGTTLGIVENLISPQELLNKALSQELHVVNTTANSGWKLKQGSLQNMTEEDLEERGAEDGLLLVLNNPADADKITPNSIPTGLDRVSFKADESLKEVSMVSDSMRGFDRSDVAAKAIKAKQARGTVSLAPVLDNLDQTRRIMVRNVTDVWQHYYTEDRVIQMTGREMGAEPEEIAINQVTPEGEVVNDLTVGEYDAVLITVPARETYEQSQFQEAIELRQLGIPVPDDILIEHSHLNRKTEIAKRIKKLNGGEEPSEKQLQQQEQLAELEMRAKEAEVEEREADAQLKQANAALSVARANTEMAQAQAAGNAGNEEAQKLMIEREKMALEREKTLEGIRNDRMAMLADINLKRETAEAELEIKREELAASIEMKRKESAAKAAATKQVASASATAKRTPTTPTSMEKKSNAR
jgi:hypothetical protein